jgi:2,3-bisphosphoglycerate-dependent phosphoglycerate mutase
MRPVAVGCRFKRHWRLNERHYGDLTGKNKKETAEKFGAEQLLLWRRSYDVPPPPLPQDDPRSNLLDPRYRDIDPKKIPNTECLKDVVARVSPYYSEIISEDLRREAVHGGAVLVVAHGNCTTGVAHDARGHLAGEDH